MAHPADAIEITSQGNEPRISVRVVPGASRTKLAGVWGKSLRIAVAAPPEGGRANDELTAFVAQALRLKRGAVRIVRGQTQRSKLLALRGVTVASVRELLRACLLPEK